MNQTQNDGTRRRICVIGAGTAGLVACKTAIQEGNGAEVVCYERSASSGGIWWYRHDEMEQTTVMEFTVTNTSKEMSSFSDFPPDQSCPPYMPHRKMLEYLRKYADHFGVTQCIKFNHAIQQVRKNGDRWIITVDDREKGKTLEEEFDKVMICIGHHSIPRMPDYENQESFQGRIIHGKHFKTADGYRGKKVLVVGLGNSAVDIATSLIGVTEQVYVSVRRGTWIYPSHFSGVPTDYTKFKRFLLALPSSVVKFLMTKHIQDFFNHDLVSFTPVHSPLSQQGTLNDSLPRALLSKQILLKPSIARFTPNGVIFNGSETETEVDEVIVATGYRPDIPFVDSSYYSKHNVKGGAESLLLYKKLYSLCDDTIAFIGMVETSGNLGQLFEMQARHAMAVFNGKLKLPKTETERLSIIEKDFARHKDRFLQDSDRHAVMVDKYDYMDDLAEQIGVKPNFFNLALEDMSLASLCFFGPLLPYQYRLNGPYKWSGARKAIMTSKQRMFAGLQPEIPLPRTRFPQSTSLSTEVILCCFFVLIMLLLLFQ